MKNSLLLAAALIAIHANGLAQSPVKVLTVNGNFLQVGNASVRCAGVAAADPDPNKVGVGANVANNATRCTGIYSGTADNNQAKFVHTVEVPGVGSLNSSSA